ncbi:hypothetical protein Hanom_Chr00s172858g01829461 [Helianthus anomalus]
MDLLVHLPLQQWSCGDILWFGYVKLRDFFKLGILMAFINMTIWGLV